MEKEPPLVVRLGVSACLLGQKVRVDGGHKRSRFLTDTLGPHVEWVPVCPEVEIGMPIPRPPLRLVRGPRERGGERPPPRLVVRDSGEDIDDDMRVWGQKRAEQLQALDLHGYVFKKDSPSCGLFRVRVYDQNGIPSREGRGVWADTFTAANPLLPVEEEGRLNDVPLRENFVLRVFTYARWKAATAERGDVASVVRFHTQHKLCLMSHNDALYRELGNLVAGAGRLDWDELVSDYEQKMMKALVHPASRKRHINVLQHLAGFVKKRLDGDQKREYEELTNQYRNGLVPLIVPITLLRHHLRTKDPHPWALDQVYLDPYPAELMLRNYI